MIFDSVRVTALIEEWKATGDDHTLGCIVEESISLAEVIASRYPREHRDDLIQECLARIGYALKYYNIGISNPHSYLTSVFINQCNSFISNENKGVTIAYPLEGDQPSVDFPDITEDDVVTDLIARNRARFPSIPVDLIDECTMYVYECMIDGVKGKARGAIASMVEEFGLRRNVATVIYHSTLVYLRMTYRKYALIDDTGTSVEELSLLPELEEFLGSDAFLEISIIFGGLYIKLPQ